MMEMVIVEWALGRCVEVEDQRRPGPGDLQGPITQSSHGPVSGKQNPAGSSAPTTVGQALGTLAGAAAEAVARVCLNVKVSARSPSLWVSVSLPQSLGSEITHARRCRWAWEIRPLFTVNKRFVAAQRGARLSRPWTLSHMARVTSLGCAGSADVGGPGCGRLLAVGRALGACLCVICGQTVVLLCLNVSIRERGGHPRSEQLGAAGLPSGHRAVTLYPSAGLCDRPGLSLAASRAAP
ncbi:Hypothetical predicted protein [Marmota monax]|uniref:Uncharacterized protein n=1 Tax=Marmota monax TaxID=9995 RepID=A0A5E4A461_MARMO|nr:Hypothetical predicted protein [Marmota monax]